MRALTTRDEEVLRTLLRCQVVSTSSLQQGLFPSVRVAQRRLQSLRALGLVVPHRKGLPDGYGGGGPTYFRLTLRGLQRLGEAMPNEEVPAEALDRAAQASLRFFEHRDRLTELYLAVITDRDLDAGEMRSRASSFFWRGEYHVTLRYDAIEAAAKVPRRVLPDATASTKTCRVFVELDRSTETVSRCRKALSGYEAHVTQGHYRQTFADELPATVLYVTRSGERQGSLARAFRSPLPQGLSAQVLPFPDAVTFLRTTLCGSAGRPPAASPAPPDALDVLGQLYEAYRAELEASRAAGRAVDAPACLHDAYALLSNRIASEGP